MLSYRRGLRRARLRSPQLWALPALKELPLYDNLASFEAEETVYDARDGLSYS